MSKKYSRAFLILMVLFSSCTRYRSVPYFQDLKADSVLKEKITNYSPVVIQPGDLLRMHLTSLNNEADQLFNYNLERPNNIESAPDLISNGTTIKNEPNSLASYLVDHDGYLHFPMIDTVKVAGYTIDQANHLVESRLLQILSRPIVSLQFENLKVSVLGDVGKPDTYYFQNERVTLSQALAYAGDLNATGIRNNVLLIREIDGNREYIHIDMTSTKIFHSPYYYLKNNDVVYVTPNRQKLLPTDSFLQGIAVVISAISLAIYLNRK